MHCMHKTCSSLGSRTAVLHSVGASRALPTSLIMLVLFSLQLEIAGLLRTVYGLNVERINTINYEVCVCGGGHGRC